MISNYEIRKKSREQLGKGIFDRKWLMTVVAYIVCSAIVGALSSIGIGLIFAGCLMFGYYALFLSIARGKDEVDIGQLFDGFKGDRFGKSLVLYILTTLYTFLWSLLFVIPGIVKSYSYSMAFYIMHDRPDLTASQCIDESRRLMDGRKMDLFCLHLSFIGWAILCVFTLGIGALWLEPYMQTAQANFYEELKKEKGCDY
jgi:uncharacterized membrane protein